MIFEYDENNLDKFENFKGGEKYIEAKMYFDGLNRFMIGHIPTVEVLENMFMKQTVR